MGWQKGLLERDRDWARVRGSVTREALQWACLQDQEQGSVTLKQLYKHFKQSLSLPTPRHGHGRWCLAVPHGTTHGMLHIPRICLYTGLRLPPRTWQVSFTAV